MVMATKHAEKINDEELVVDIGLQRLIEDIVCDREIPDDPIYNAFPKSITDILVEIPIADDSRVILRPVVWVSQRLECS